MLAASYYFYMSWKVEYVFLIIASTVSAYIAAVILERQGNLSYKRLCLVITLLFNLGILFVFKYFNFINDSLRDIFNYFNVFYEIPALKLLLPVGISFYTFSVISYLIDVYKGEIEAEKHLGLFATFVVFFPKLIAGPIERGKNLLPQFHEKHDFDYPIVREGLQLIAWGLFKKMVIADRVAVYVDQIYNNPTDYTGLPVIIASIFFAIQVYCDFSGYSDMAIGSAQIFGFRLMKNFDRPFAAKTVAEFWARWHISLTSWVKDYLYMPMLISGRAWGQVAVVISLVITFVVVGLWHEASWTFVIFGLLHGLMLSFEAVTKKSRRKLKKIIPRILHDNISMLFVFSFFCFTCVFFRANSVTDAFLLIRNMVSIDFTNLNANIAQMPRYELLIALFSISILELIQYIQLKISISQFIAKRNLLFRWTVYIAFITFILFFRKTGPEFIYFQF